MAEFPAITHVALTVSTLDRSVPWYEPLFGTKPVIDEDTGPFRHVVWLVGQTLVGDSAQRLRQAPLRAEW